MSKITLEIDLNLFEDDGSLDDAIESRIISSLVDRIYDDFSSEVSKKVAERAEKYIAAKTELVINTVLERPITITEGWGKSTEYESIFDMVEQKMSALYQGKLGGKDGKCEKDPVLVKVEANIKATADSILSRTEKLIKNHAEKTVRQQLASHELIKAIGAVVHTDNSVELSGGK